MLFHIGLTLGANSPYVKGWCDGDLRNVTNEGIQLPRHPQSLAPFPWFWTFFSIRVILVLSLLFLYYLSSIQDLFSEPDFFPPGKGVALPLILSEVFKETFFFSAKQKARNLARTPRMVFIHNQLMLEQPSGLTL